jgi:hypothetical protein
VLSHYDKLCAAAKPNAAEEFTMSEINPYQPPVAAATTGDSFNVHGRSRSAGSGWQWIETAFTLFMKQPVMWALLVVGFFIGTLGASLLFLVPLFGGGLMAACRAIDRGEPIEIGYLFAGFREKPGDLILAGVFATVAFIVIMVPAIMIVGVSGIFALITGSVTSIAALGVTLLLVILIALAVMIPIYMALWFAPPLIVLEGLGVGQALKASFFGCLKNVIPFLLYGIVLHVFSWLAAAFTYGIGFVFLVPVAIASIYTAYRDIYCTSTP